MSVPRRQELRCHNWDRVSGGIGTCEGRWVVQGRCVLGVGTHAAVEEGGNEGLRGLGCDVVVEVFPAGLGFVVGHLKSL